MVIAGLGRRPERALDGVVSTVEQDPGLVPRAV